MSTYTVLMDEKLAALIAKNGGSLTVGEFYEVVSC